MVRKSILNTTALPLVAFGLFVGAGTIARAEDNSALQPTDHNGRAVAQASVGPDVAPRDPNGPPKKPKISPASRTEEEESDSPRNSKKAESKSVITSDAIRNGGAQNTYD